MTPGMLTVRGRVKLVDHEMTKGPPGTKGAVMAEGLTGQEKRQQSEGHIAWPTRAVRPRRALQQADLGSTGALRRSHPRLARPPATAEGRPFSAGSSEASPKRLRPAIRAPPPRANTASGGDSQE